MAVSIRREPVHSFLIDLTAPAKPEMALEIRKGDMTFISAPDGGREEESEKLGWETSAPETEDRGRLLRTPPR